MCIRDSCINTSKFKSVFVDSELIDNFSSSQSEIEGSPDVYVQGDKVQGFNSFDTELVSSSTSRPKRTHREGLENTDPSLYVYTS